MSLLVGLMLTFNIDLKIMHGAPRLFLETVLILGQLINQHKMKRNRWRVQKTNHWELGLKNAPMNYGLMGVIRTYQVGLTYQRLAQPFQRKPLRRKKVWKKLVVIRIMGQCKGSYTGSVYKYGEHVSIFADGQTTTIFNVKSIDVTSCTEEIQGFFH